jgi:hypothetical protein
MPLRATPSRRLGLIWIPVRILLVTVLSTLLSFAVTLLLGILGIVIGARLHGTVPSMTNAYRYIAVPAAAAVGTIALVSAIALEVRHYRQGRALAGIERASK